MRKLLLVFLLLLTPLRGFMGDAMAYAMTMTDLSPSVSFQPKAVAPVAQHGDENVPCHAKGSAALDDEAEHNKCTFCQTCHFSVLMGASFSDCTSEFKQAAPEQGLRIWYSAELFRLAKPPTH